jgi:hypothetical protein
MALLTNLGTAQLLFRTRNGINYVIQPGGNITVPDEEAVYDQVDSALQAGTLQITLASGFPARSAQQVVLVDPTTGVPYAASQGAVDKEFVVTTYFVKTAFAGASIGDTVTATQVIDVSGALPTTVTTIWRNQTTATDFASTPSASNLQLLGSQALTDAQLRASPVVISGSSAVGSPPAMPPLSVSGVDGSGNKQHLRTDTLGNVGVYGAASRSTATATISNGTSVSGSIDLSTTALLGFIAPSAWTTASLSLEVSVDNTNWAAAIYDSTNSSTGYWASVVAGSAYAVDTVSMLPFRYVRLRSGTSAAPVVQGADRAFVVITRPLA